MINKNYHNLTESYLFSEVGRRAREYQKAHPDKKVISMGVGDVTRPLSPVVCEAMAKATREMGTPEGFRGYGAEQGTSFLRKAVAEYYTKRNVSLSPDDIFISDGAKSDLGNILDIFDTECSVLIQDPVYPVYVDTSTMDGRKIIYNAANTENGFLPLPPEKPGAADIIYLCSPNNPCGVAYTKSQLQAWVDYARSSSAVILFDAAYEVFIRDTDVPHSIYELEGAKECAIEFCSFSKMAGFTGVRCGYTVVPEELVRDGTALRKLWLRRQSTKFNGVSYITQRGAEAVFTDEGQKQIFENIDYYMKNADIITQTLEKAGVAYTGGRNSPYIWMACPGGEDSWAFFDRLLNEAQIVGTPGAGFGVNGKNYFRLTGFSTHENTIEAMRRIEAFLSGKSI